MEATVKFDVDSTLNRFKEFTKELEELCSKYDLEPQYAHDDETNDNYIVVDIKDFIKEEDIDIEIEK